ncbi:hypothetical protein FRC00_004275, partial [Tulasnella sp. 408]
MDQDLSVEEQGAIGSSIAHLHHSQRQQQQERGLSGLDSLSQQSENRSILEARSNLAVDENSRTPPPPSLTVKGASQGRDLEPAADQPTGTVPQVGSPRLGHQLPVMQHQQQQPPGGAVPEPGEMPGQAPYPPPQMPMGWQQPPHGGWYIKGEWYPYMQHRQPPYMQPPGNPKQPLASALLPTQQPPTPANTTSPRTGPTPVRPSLTTPLTAGAREFVPSNLGGSSPMIPLPGFPLPKKSKAIKISNPNTGEAVVLRPPDGGHSRTLSRDAAVVHESSPLRKTPIRMETQEKKRAREEKERKAKEKAEAKKKKDAEEKLEERKAKRKAEEAERLKKEKEERLKNEAEEKKREEEEAEKKRQEDENTHPAAPQINTNIPPSVPSTPAPVRPSLTTPLTASAREFVPSNLGRSPPMVPSPGFPLPKKSNAIKISNPNTGEAVVLRPPDGGHSRTLSRETAVVHDISPLRKAPIRMETRKEKRAREKKEREEAEAKAKVEEEEGQPDISVQVPAQGPATNALLMADRDDDVGQLATDINPNRISINGHPKDVFHGVGGEVIP